MSQVSSGWHLGGDGIGQKDGSKRAAVVAYFIKIRSAISMPGLPYILLPLAAVPISAAAAGI